VEVEVSESSIDREFREAKECAERALMQVLAALKQGHIVDFKVEWAGGVTVPTVTVSPKPWATLYVGK
jgi:hypothetical protein